MDEQVINIDIGTAKVLDLDSDGQGMFIAFCDNGQVIVNDKRVFINSQIQFPIIRSIDDSKFLLADSRTEENKPNAFVYDFTGQLLSSFVVGDGIQDILVHHNKIVVTYFDEGVFGADGPNNNGLSVFSFNGKQEFGFNESVDGLHIYDCYCICKHGTDKVLFYAYDYFDVTELNLDTYKWQQIKTPTDFQGFSALTSKDNKIIFHSSYDDKQSFFEWDRQTMELKTIGKYSSQIKGLNNGKFLAVGESGFTLISL